jgi:hypothetical protein
MPFPIDNNSSSFHVSDDDLSARGLNKNSCFRSDLETDAFVCLDMLLLMLAEAAGGRTKVKKNLKRRLGSTQLVLGFPA